MVTREDSLRRLAYLARSRHDVALWAIAFLSVDISTDMIANCVEGAEELAAIKLPFIRSHLEAFEERFGVRPRL
jgi:hypothetical protein